MTFHTAQLVIVTTTTAIATASAAVGALVAAPPRRSVALPWWERARLVFPARVAPVISVCLLAQVTVVATLFGFEIYGARPPMWRLAVDGLAPLLGPIAVAMVAAWLAAGRRASVGHWFAGCASATLFRFPGTVLYVCLLVALGLSRRDGPSVATILIVGAAGMSFIAWGGGIWVARVLGLARPALPRAAQAADWAGERVGTRASAVYEIRWPRVRVDAFVFSRYLVVTDAAARLLTDEELFALAVREATFFRPEQRWLVGTLRVADSALVFVMLACVAIGMAFGGHTLLVGPLLAFGSVLVLRPFLRRAQLKADALAAEAETDRGLALRALERQYELNLQPVVSASKRSHEPHLYDRMLAAGLAPAYPRPAPPSKGRVTLAIVTTVAMSLILSAGFLFAWAVVLQG